MMNGNKFDFSNVSVKRLESWQKVKVSQAESHELHRIIYTDPISVVITWYEYKA